LDENSSLPLDFLCGTSSQESKFLENNYVSQLRKKLDLVHERIKQQLDLRSQKVNVLYNSKPDGYYLKRDKKFGCSILEGLKGGLPSYKVIGMGLTLLKYIERCRLLHSKVK